MINFIKIRWRNFLSTGNAFTEIPLDKHATSLIIGENGAGKSTILDALTFVLFGKAFRKINKPMLINSVNTKECIVEIEFEIGSNQYRVVRGMKPSVFEIYCNGILLNQDSASRDYQEHLEKMILKMNYKSFTQIVILGSASFTPFMQLSASDRRSIIEDLLDIEIFSKMNVIAKQKMQNNRENIEKTSIALSGKEEKKVYVEKTIRNLKQNNEEKKLSLQGQNDLLRHEMANLSELLKSKGEERNALLMSQSQLEKEGARTKHTKLISLLSKIETNLSKVKSDADFYDHNNTCPTCRQTFSETFKAEFVEDSQKKMNEYKAGIEKIKKEIAKYVQLIAEADEKHDELQKLKMEIANLNSQFSSLEEKCKTNEKAINLLENADQLLIDSQAELESLNKSIDSLSKYKNDLLEERQYIDTAISLLKDGGIKTKIIKQYLPIINKHINKYLSQMGFFVNFHINEQFEETIKSRYRDDFSYQNFSEGEKMRIDLAILFTWRTIAKMKNSVNTNLLILDEVFDSSLDVNGTDEFLKIMWNFVNDTNTFVISHKQDQLIDKFEKTYRFAKAKNFSRITN